MDALEHIPVLTTEVIKYLNIHSQGIYVDATLGGGGHSQAILKHLDKGTLYAFDQDIFAIEYCRNKFRDVIQIELINENFIFLKQELITKRNINSIDGIVFDLGLSSFQIDNVARGFSYLKDFFLDMRMNPLQKKTAYDVVNTYSYEELKKIFLFYGEEPKSALIAKAILKQRPIKNTLDLVKITDHFYPISYRNMKKGHSAKKIFQALRIEVNQELKCLQSALEQSIDLLKKNGRLVVISFNSLEDRLVKHFFKKHNSLPLDLINIPFTVDNLPPQKMLQIITPKVIFPQESEIKNNSRARSAKLRAVQKNL